MENVLGQLRHRSGLEFDDEDDIVCMSDANGSSYLRQTSMSRSIPSNINGKTVAENIESLYAAICPFAFFGSKFRQRETYLNACHEWKDRTNSEYARAIDEVQELDDPSATVTVFSKSDDAKKAAEKFMRILDSKTDIVNDLNSRIVTALDAILFVQRGFTDGAQAQFEDDDNLNEELVVWGGCWTTAVNELKQICDDGKAGRRRSSRVSLSSTVNHAKNKDDSGEEEAEFDEYHPPEAKKTKFSGTRKLSAKSSHSLTEEGGDSPWLDVTVPKPAPKSRLQPKRPLSLDSFGVNKTAAGKTYGHGSSNSKQRKKKSHDSSAISVSDSDQHSDGNETLDAHLSKHKEHTSIPSNFMRSLDRRLENDNSNSTERRTLDDDDDDDDDRVHSTQLPEKPRTSSGSDILSRLTALNRKTFAGVGVHTHFDDADQGHNHIPVQNASKSTTPRQETAAAAEEEVEFHRIAENFMSYTGSSENALIGEMDQSNAFALGQASNNIEGTNAGTDSHGRYSIGGKSIWSYIAQPLNVFVGDRKSINNSDTTNDEPAAADLSSGNRIDLTDDD